MGILAQRISAYLGFVWVALLFIGFWAIGRFVPPSSPLLGPQEIKDFFAANTTGIRIGMLSNMLAGALMLRWCAAWAVQTKRIEGARRHGRRHLEGFAPRAGNSSVGATTSGT